MALNNPTTASTSKETKPTAPELPLTMCYNSRLSNLKLKKSSKTSASLTKLKATVANGDVKAASKSCNPLPTFTSHSSSSTSIATASTSQTDQLNNPPSQVAPSQSSIHPTYLLQKSFSPRSNRRVQHFDQPLSQSKPFQHSSPPISPALITPSVKQEYETCCIVLWCERSNTMPRTVQTGSREPFYGEVLCSENVQCPHMHLYFDERTLYNGESIAVLGIETFRPGTVLEIQTVFMPINANDDRHYFFIIENITHLSPLPAYRPRVKRIQVVQAFKNNYSSYARAVDSNFYYVRIPPFLQHFEFIKSAIQEGVQSKLHIRTDFNDRNFRIDEVLECEVIMCPRWVDGLLEDSFCCRRLVLSLHSRVPSFTGIGPIVEIRDSIGAIVEAEKEDTASTSFRRLTPSIDNLVYIPLKDHSDVKSYRIGRRVSFESCESLRKEEGYGQIAMTHCLLGEEALFVEDLEMEYNPLRVGTLIDLMDDTDDEQQLQLLPQQLQSPRAPDLPQSLSELFDTFTHSADTYSSTKAIATLPSCHKYLTSDEKTWEAEIAECGFSPPKEGERLLPKLCEWRAPPGSFRYGDEIPCHLTVDPVELALQESERLMMKNRRRRDMDAETESDRSDDEWEDTEYVEAAQKRGAENLLTLRTLDGNIAKAERERAAAAAASVSGKERTDRGRKRFDDNDPRVKRLIRHFGRYIDVKEFTPSRIDEPMSSEWLPNGPARTIGLYDDIELIISSTLGRIPEKTEKDKSAKPAARKYWLSRMSPRSTPTVYVTEFVRERDVLRDITQDSPRVDRLERTFVYTNKTHKQGNETNKTTPPFTASNSNGSS